VLVIRSSELKVGDVFYGIHERNTAFHRKKIHREIGGEDWFKYDRPLVTYELVTYKVLGILRKELEGEWKFGDEYDLETEFCIRRTNDTHAQHYTDTLDNEEKYFLDKDEAMVYLKSKELEAKELDKT
jgi:hypothetical protein